MFIIIYILTYELMHIIIQKYKWVELTDSSAEK